LRPIKRKQISEIVAERLSLSAETVDEIISCYYKAVQKQLSSLQDVRVRVNSLGTFYIKRKKLEEKLQKYTDALAKFEANPEPGLSDYKSMVDIRADIATFNNALKQLDLEDVKKLAKEEEKQIYKLNKNESNQTMEGEGQDS
jgi:nucleoid DNA-binding protein